MKLESVQDLKQEILATTTDYYQSQGDFSSVAESLVAQPPANRLAVGHLLIGQNNYRLELRPQRDDRYGYRLAEQYKAKLGDEANIEIVPRIEIPPRSATRDAAAITPILTPPGPLEIGLSIGHNDGGIGTLGGFVNRDDGISLLSCNHVIANNGVGGIKFGPNGDPIYHPGREPGYTMKGSRQIGHLAEFILLTQVEGNELDCAVARLDCDGWDAGENVIPARYPHAGAKLRVIDDLSILSRGKVVCKIGRTTGFTTGLIRAVELDNVTVLYHGIGNIAFDGVYEIRWQDARTPFTQPGDSGSIIFTEDEFFAFGLHFAGGSRHDGVGVSYCCDLRKTLVELDADWVD